MIVTWPVIWIGAVIATVLYYVEKTDFARSIPVGNLLRQHFNPQTELPMLHGKVAVVTGASSGLGYETVRVLGGRLCATVVMATRDTTKGHTARDRILHEFPNAELVVVHMDLANFSSVRLAARLIKSQFSRIDILVNNAGVAATFPPRKSVDDVEVCIQTNFLSHVLLTELLIDNMKHVPRSPRDGEQKDPEFAPRIVFLTSSLHRAAPIEGVWLETARHNNFSSYSLTQRYAIAKLACLVIAEELDRRYHRSHGVYVNAVHPGVVATDILRDPTGVALSLGIPARWAAPVGRVVRGAKGIRDALVAYSPTRGALTQIYAAAHPDVQLRGVRGKYLVPIAQEWPTAHSKSNNEAFGKALYEWSATVVGTSIKAVGAC